MVLYCEDYITMHMESLSQGLYKAAQDEEREVVEKVGCNGYPVFT